MSNSEIEKHINILHKYIEENNNLEAVKYIRTIGGTGLKEAKQIFDRFKETGNLPKNLFIQEQDENSFAEEKSSAEIELIRQKARDLLRLGRTIEAVKYVKINTGWGLKESKDFIDKILAKERFNPEILASDQLFLDEEKSDMGRFAIENENSSVKSSNQRGSGFDDITFEKSKNREFSKNRDRDNSGCMVSLFFMALSGAGLGFLLHYIIS